MNTEKLLRDRIDRLLRENAKLAAVAHGKLSPYARQLIRQASKRALHFEEWAHTLIERVRVLEARIVRLQGGRSIAREVEAENERIVAAARAYANEEPHLRRQDIAARLVWERGVSYKKAYKLITGIGFGAHRKPTKRLKRKPNR